MSPSNKPAPCDPDDTVYGFPAKPPKAAPEAPVVLKARRRSHGTHRGPALNRPNSSLATSPPEQWGYGWCGFFFCFLLASSFVAAVYCLYLIWNDEPYPRLFLSALYLSSFGISPWALQLNGTWHLALSMVYQNHPASRYFPYEGAAVSLYYKGAYLAGVDLHTFRVAQEHPLLLEVNVDATRRDVPGWLARDLAEVGRVGVMELEVQFVARRGRVRDYYLCGNMSLGFSTAEEAKLIGDGPVRCPLIA
ncbi:uncharacterized protein J3R85_013355 [Psidium guajava]|nr:uncharacterized protein J3R85_013355 [Psidium guajava]